MPTESSSLILNKRKKFQTVFIFTQDQVLVMQNNFYWHVRKFCKICKSFIIANNFHPKLVLRCPWYPIFQIAYILITKIRHHIPVYLFISLSEKILTCHVQKDCLELPYTVTEFWHAMYKRWGSAVLPDKEVISHTEQVLKDGQEASLILLVRRIHLLQYFKAMIGISILNQLRKSWHMHQTLQDFIKPANH